MNYPRGQIFDSYQDRRQPPLDPRSQPPHGMDNGDKRRFDHMHGGNRLDPPFPDQRPHAYNNHGARPAMDPRQGGNQNRFGPADNKPYFDRPGYGPAGPVGYAPHPYDDFPPGGIGPPPPQGRQGQFNYNPAARDHLRPPDDLNHQRRIHQPPGPGVDVGYGEPPNARAFNGNNRANLGFPPDGMDRPFQRGNAPPNNPPQYPPYHQPGGMDRHAFARTDGPALSYQESASRLPPTQPANNQFLQASSTDRLGLGPPSVPLMPAAFPRPQQTPINNNSNNMPSNSNGQPPAQTHHLLVDTPSVASALPVVTEVLAIPPELAAVAGEASFRDIIERVKEQLLLVAVNLSRAPDGTVDSLVIDAATREKASLARNLLETHLKQQWKIKMAESRLQKLQTDLHSTQGDISSGHMVEVIISAELVGLTIGKKGSRIKQIESETGVTNINVGDNGHIVIYGSDPAAVQRAREQLELKEERCKLTPMQVEWISNKANGNVIAELRTSASLMLAKLHFDSGSIEMIGTHQSVEMGKLLLSTQLEYIDKQIEIDNSEKNARERLQAVRKQFGMNNANWKNRKGDNDATVPANVSAAQAAAVAQNQKLPSDPDRNPSLPPPPGLDRKANTDNKQGNKSAPVVVKTVDDHLDALISSVTAPSSNSASREVSASNNNGKGQQKKSQQQQQQQQQQQADNKNGKGQQKNEKKSGGKNETFAAFDLNANIDLFEISQASAKMRLDHPQSQIQKPQTDGKKDNGSSDQPSRQKGKDNKPKDQPQESTSKQNKSEQASSAAANDQSKKGKNNGGKKEGEKREVEKRGRTVQVEGQSSSDKLPPPPTLTVPAPSEAKDNEDDKKGKRDRKKKGNTKQKDAADNVTEAKEASGQDAKEPMLTKINLPFQKSQAPTDAPSSPIVPIPPRSSGPPKDPTSLLVIPPSGPPAKELSMSIVTAQPKNNGESETKTKKPQDAETDLSAKKRSPSHKTHSGESAGPSESAVPAKSGADQNTATTTNNSSISSIPASPSDKKSDSSSRRLNVSKAAIMDSLMTVRPDSVSSSSVKSPVSSEKPTPFVEPASVPVKSDIQES